MTVETDGVRFNEGLRVGMLELNWWEEELNLLARRRRIANMLTPGLVVARTSGGDLEASWQVHDDNNDGTVSIRLRAKTTQAGRPALPMLVDADGNVVPATRDLALTDLDILTIPNDNTWYTVLVRGVLSDYQPGTMTFVAGSPDVTGTSTEFNRYAGKDTFGRGTIIRVDVADSAALAGEYEVKNITSATAMKLETNAPANGTVPFVVKGEHQGFTPSEQDAFVVRRSEFSLVAVTREPSAGYFVLADVKRNDADPIKVKIIDRRMQNIWRPALRSDAQHRGVVVAPTVKVDSATAPYTALTLKRYQVEVTAAHPVSGTALCQGRNSGQTDKLIGVFAATGAINKVRCNVWDAATEGWTAGGDIDATGLATSPHVCQLPVILGNTHIAGYVKSGTVRRRFTTDDGATWGAEATIWDPTTVDPANTVDHPFFQLLQNHRLLCYATYFNNAAGATEIRLIYSDDYGTTWQVNGGAGWVVRNPDLLGAVDVAHPFAAQAEDGMIYVAYDQNAQFCKVAATTDKLGLDWTTLTATNSFSNFNIGNVAGGAALNPTLWVSPDGPLVVVYSQVITASHLNVRYAVIGRTRHPGNAALGDKTLAMLWDEYLLRGWTDGAVAATDTLRLGLCQSRQGQLHLSLWGTLDAAAVNRLMLHVPLHVHSQPLATMPVME